jgi:hypothetical protein
MQAVVKSRVLVGCRGTKANPHSRLVRLRHYDWSTTESVWVRADGGDDDWYIRDTPDGLEGYPHPRFMCPLASCPNDRVYEHDTFQDLVERASKADGLVLI